MLNSGHSDGHHHKNNILELVEFEELGAFFVIHLAEIVKEVGLYVLLRPLFVFLCISDSYSGFLFAIFC